MTTLLCSDATFRRFGPKWLASHPTLRIIALVNHVDPTATDLAAVDIAYFSDDLWPVGSAHFMRVCVSAPNVKWLQNAFVGTDHPVFTALRNRGVVLTNSAGSSGRPIAHSVIMHLLSMCRKVRSFADDQRQHRWRQTDVDDVEGRTVVIIGMGAIGGEVARLAGELGMRAIGVRRAARGDETCETWPVGRLHEALSLADDVVLAVPLTDDTRLLIGAAQIAAMQAGVHLVNVGRGELVDEPAMIDALRSGHIGAACLDVFTVEPLPTDSALWDLPNVTITPHSSGSTAKARERGEQMFDENLARYLDGQPLVNPA